MRDSRRMIDLKFMIDKLENGTSVVYPEGNPQLLLKYKEALSREESYWNWIIWNEVPSEMIGG